eukprot:CAMPEP_0204393370 /NCGR_PEP_ID=MMETSP0469-20131031/62282_1 /ASSEMBLY_ACC=CAM_ASM_000384 /TAXON_ID=2969 /ORGANISM="Oxyrrhis marina" /LENGTH=133 /DNA_ID=CAMNT_0051387435 /DNA_START=577 /DNA_END=974 /DNA_ORIENTATION=+
MAIPILVQGVQDLVAPAPPHGTALIDFRDTPGIAQLPWVDNRLGPSEVVDVPATLANNDMGVDRENFPEKFQTMEERVGWLELSGCCVAPRLRVHVTNVGGVIILSSKLPDLKASPLQAGDQGRKNATLRNGR